MLAISEFLQTENCEEVRRPMDQERLNEVALLSFKKETASNIYGSAEGM
jgi:hypothetical protein